MSSQRAIILAFTCAALFAAPAQAQRSPEDARAAFDVGVRASRDNQWNEAVEAFRRSYDLAPRPLTMFNLAGALTQVGELVEAAEAYRAFLATAQSGRAARLREEAEEHLRELEARIPRVRFQIVGLEPTDTVQLDEFDVAPSSLDIPVAVDPGTHTFLVRRGDRERSIPFTASEGAVSEVVFDARLEAIGDGTAEASTPPNEESGPSVIEEPWFWVVLGGAVVVGLGVGLGVYFGTQPAPPPFVGSLGMAVPL